jgi:hypothetical protein
MGSEPLREELRRMQHEAAEEPPPAMTQDRLERLQTLMRREQGPEANVDAARVKWFVAYLQRLRRLRLRTAAAASLPSYSGEASAPPAPPYPRSSSLPRSRSRSRPLQFEDVRKFASFERP